MQISLTLTIDNKYLLNLGGGVFFSGATASSSCSSECPQGNGQCGEPDSNSIYRMDRL